MGGLGRIYFTAIECYAVRNGIADSEFETFLSFVRAIDEEYIAHVNAQTKAEMDKS